MIPVLYPCLPRLAKSFSNALWRYVRTNNPYGYPEFSYAQGHHVMGRLIWIADFFFFLLKDIRTTTFFVITPYSPVAPPTHYTSTHYPQALSTPHSYTTTIPSHIISNISMSLKLHIITILKVYSEHTFDATSREFEVVAKFSANKQTFSLHLSTLFSHTHKHHSVPSLFFFFF